MAKKPKGNHRAYKEQAPSSNYYNETEHNRTEQQ